MQSIFKFKMFFLIGLCGFLGFSGLVYADAPLETFIIRNGDSVFWNGSVSLPEAGTVEIPDKNGILHSINARSVLAILLSIDEANDSFSVSDLQYYDSFGSFYVKCLTSSGDGELCDNWQYVVNDVSPFSSIDQNILSGGEIIYLYFGNQHRVRLSASQISTNQEMTVSAEKYSYSDNTWVLLAGVTVGLTQPNPDDPFNPTEIFTQSVNENGQATFKLTTAGSYNVGIKEDFYFPTESLNVVDPPPPSGGEILPPKKDFDLTQAYDFLISRQEENGSFGEDIYTDWATLALASTPDFMVEKEKIKDYFLREKFFSEILTDYERRSMALMALGINPYDVLGEDYIKKIIDSFDGVQFGDEFLVNDDIFALIPLLNAGYSFEDELIKKDISFIVSRQNPNGSWEESVDLTGAGMAALSLFKDEESVKTALNKAKEFLKQNQKKQGGWENISSTSWAVLGILSLTEDPSIWIKDEHTPMDYLAFYQESDGGMINGDIKNKVWETSYAVLALSGKTWSQVMHKFDRPVSKTLEEIAKEIPIIETGVTGGKIMKNEAIAPIVVEKTGQKIRKISSQNVASPIMADTEISILKEIPTPAPRQSWFRRFLKRIFGF